MRCKKTRKARKRKPAGYWDDPGNLKRELVAFATEHGMPGRMPSWAQLRAAGRADLAGAIDAHGGQHAVAQALGLDDAGLKKARGYWQDYANVEHEPGRRTLADTGGDSTMSRVSYRRSSANTASRV